MASIKTTNNIKGGIVLEISDRSMFIRLQAAKDLINDVAEDMEKLGDEFEQATETMNLLVESLRLVEEHFEFTPNEEAAHKFYGEGNYEEQGDSSKKTGD